MLRMVWVWKSYTYKVIYTLLKLNINQSYDSYIFNQKKLNHKKTHRRILLIAALHNSQKKEKKNQMSINKIMDKQIVVKQNIIKQQNRTNH